MTLRRYDHHGVVASDLDCQVVAVCFELSNAREVEVELIASMRVQLIKFVAQSSTVRKRATPKVAFQEQSPPSLNQEQVFT